MSDADPLALADQLDDWADDFENEFYGVGTGQPDLNEAAAELRRLVSECAELRAELAGKPDDVVVLASVATTIVPSCPECAEKDATLAAVRDFATPLQIDHRSGDHTQFSRGWEAAKVRVLALLDGETEAT